MEMKDYFAYVAFAFMSRGLILSLLRLTEPAFLGQIVDFLKKKLSSCCSKATKDDTMITESSMSAGNIKDFLQMSEEDPAIVFLSSSLNNMLVCSILKGIHLSLSQFAYDPMEAVSSSETIDLSFDKIEIMDPRIFQNLKLSELKSMLQNLH